MKNTFYLLFVFLFSIASYCQENYQAGYIIDLKKDTLNGFIDYRNWEKNPKKISFKTTIEGAKTYYMPNSIVKFKVADEIYESAIIQIDNSSDKISELTYNNKFEYTTDTVFLQTLVDGVKSLYCYHAENAKQYFFVKNNNIFETLSYKKYLKTVEGKDFVRENNTYFAQLADYLANCSSIQEKITELKYEKSKLVKLFNQYYTCVGKEIKFQKKKDKISTEIGVVAGMSKAQAIIPLGYYNPFPDSELPVVYSPSGGALFNIILPRLQGRLSINNELLYVSYRTKKHYENNVNANEYTTIDAELYHNWLKINNYINYKHPIKKIFLYTGAGVSNGFMIVEVNKKRTVKYLYGYTLDEERPFIDTKTKYEIGAVGEIGIGYRKVSIGARYEKVLWATPSPFNIYNNRSYFLIKYTF